MFEMIAIMCILVWPDDVMTSKLKCTTHYEDPPREFVTVTKCEEAAYEKLEMTLAVFEERRVNFESFQIRCEPARKN